MRIDLKPRHEKKILKGYPWIFANQIEKVGTDAQRGDVVAVYDSQDNALGLGLYHESSQIAVRLLTSDTTRTIDRAFFRNRLQRARALRAALHARYTHHRVLFSESDGMPGTIVDRYGDVITWTSLSYGMEKRREELLDLLEEIYSPSAIIERNDVALRAKDDLTRNKRVLRGTVPDELEIEENGVRFIVDPINGPKTGFFMDQRFHREVVSSFASGRSMLDVCCADGGFGLQAALHGAASVRFIDSSAYALDRVKANANRNNLTNHLEYEEADALEYLGSLTGTAQRFDLIVLDPPAFAKSRRHVESATQAYQRLNINALKLLSDDGLLATSSCSQAISEADFLKIVRYSARKAGVKLNIVYRGFQPPDHPVLDSMPETHYLKFFIFQKAWS